MCYIHVIYICLYVFILKNILYITFNIILSPPVEISLTTLYICLSAPVSKPAVSQTCLSPEQMNISCSSMGDGVEFILTLDGLLLMQTRDHSQSQSCSTLDTPSLSGSTDNQHRAKISTITISVPGQLTGNLMCNVQNNVSREETVIQLASCKGSVFQEIIKFYFC